MRADFNLMRELTQHSGLKSDERARRADSWARKISDKLRDPVRAAVPLCQPGLTRRQMFAEWGVEMDAKPVEVNGVQAPRLQYSLLRNMQPALVDVPVDGKECACGPALRWWGPVVPTRGPAQ
jgi:hypothetical protein